VNHLERAREELRRASERATGTTHEQLNSIEEGILGESEGDRTRAEPGPKVDRIAELTDKLGGLEREADGAAVRERIANARDGSGRT